MNDDVIYPCIGDIWLQVSTYRHVITTHYNINDKEYLIK